MPSDPFIVAELSANHLGSFERACQLVDAAAYAGASAIKLQTFTPEQMVDPWKVIESGPWNGRNALDLYREAHTPREWHEPLFERARNKGMAWLSSAFHSDDVDFLESLEVAAIKIASFELTDLELIRYAAERAPWLIMSTGMATADEIERAVFEACRAPGARHPTLLKCTSAYPAEVSEANLLALEPMARTFRCRVGLSDHTRCAVVPTAAVALGATVIEAHLTLNRKDGGPDAEFSYEPSEFAGMVECCKIAAMARGEARFGPTEGEEASLALRRKPGGKRV